MAFSGQYAAAQLEKLDNSPLFRGSSFPLAREISDFLGYAPNFAPPCFVTWARAHGRLPLIDDDVYDGHVRAPMLVRDFNNDAFDDAGVIVKYLQHHERPLKLFEEVTVYSTPESVRARTNAGQVLFGITVEVNVGYKDMVFCQRWGRAHGANWPHTSGSIHPAISGAVRIHERHHAIWLALLREQTMIRRRYNSRLEV